MTAVWLWMPRPAHAFSLYCEMGAGATYLINAQNYFTDKNATYPMYIGPGVELNIMADVLDDLSIFDIHFGFTNRMISGLDFRSQYYNVYTPSFALRFQIWRIFFGGGISYWTFQRDSQAYFWVDGYNPTLPGLGFNAEVGFLFPISPNASFGLSANAQWLNAGGALSSIPALDLMGFFRFYFWYPTSSKSASGVTGGGHSSREWKGWRYPYGNQKN
ncbi:MAG: hypothetical protein ACXWPM_06750 [Bdellovibrionota bacterium]